MSAPGRLPGFGFGVTPGPPDGVAAEIRDAEALGYDRMGVWDSPALFRDPWMTLGAVARETSTIRLGTWVSNPVSRHPVVTASAIATLEDLAPGRAYFGIGSGGTGVWHLGHPAARLADLREYISAVRGLLADGAAGYRGSGGAAGYRGSGATAGYQGAGGAAGDRGSGATAGYQGAGGAAGDRFSACRMEWGRGVSVPIIMSAHGPRALRLAGEVADGVICGLGISPEVVSGCLDLIAEGAESAGRTLADLEVWFTCFWFVDPRPGVALAEGAWAATAFAMHFSQGRVEGKFVPEEYREGIGRLGEQYDLVAHGKVTNDLKRRYVERADALGIGDYVRSRFMFCGTPGEVESQIRAAMAAGARNFDGALDADLPERRRRIARWAELVLPRFGRGPRTGTGTDG